ncbi:hyalin-like [Ptychodera flava]|uniref:hyalin-like n=1 Tax=Ptychodera flava TaxID=63121 RepID=UPI00396A9186
MAIVMWQDPQASDNSGVSPVVTTTFSPGSKFPMGSTSVAYTATDGSGNNATCNFTVIVYDPIPTVFIGCPSDLYEFTPENEATAIANWTEPMVTDNSGIEPNVSVDALNGDRFPIGITVVIYTANDESYNTATCAFVINVTDSIPPVFFGCPVDQFLSTPANESTSMADWTEPTATDNSEERPVLTCSHFPGDHFPIGQTFVTYKAIDESQNAAVCIFSVHVDDPFPPVFTTCPLDQDIVLGPDEGNATANWTDIMVIDNSGLAPIVTQDHESGDVFSIGSTLVTYTATDNSSNSATCSFTITVLDTIPPRFDGCLNVTRVPTPVNDSMAVVTWHDPQASDNSGVSPVVTKTFSPGSKFPIGSTSVTYTATDGSGNNATCDFTVIVYDPIPPVFIGCPPDIYEFTPENEATAIANWTEPIVTDNSGIEPNVTVEFQPGDRFPIGITVVIYTAKDESYNTATCAFFINVTDSIPPVFVGCPADQFVSTPAYESTSMADWTEPTATDNSGVQPVLICSHLLGDRFAIGQTFVTYKATDESQNAALCIFSVYVDGKRQ